DDRKSGSHRAARDPSNRSVHRRDRHVALRFPAGTDLFQRCPAPVAPGSRCAHRGKRRTIFSEGQSRRGGIGRNASSAARRRKSRYASRFFSRETGWPMESESAFGYLTGGRGASPGAPAGRGTVVACSFRLQRDKAAAALAVNAQKDFFVGFQIPADLNEVLGILNRLLVHFLN